MDDSWQKLMGIDCGNEEGPSSPVFHKKKWVILPSSVKKSVSNPLPTKRPDKKQKYKKKNDSNNSLQISDFNSTKRSEEKDPRNTTVDEDDPLLIYNTTPTKKNKQKRKTIDLLSCSFRSEGNFCKKSKLNDNEHTELNKDPIDIKSENKNYELCPKTQIPTSIKVSSPQSNESRLSQRNTNYKPQRNLLYSCNEKSNSCLKAQTLTVNDIFKSVIMIDEADIHSSPKNNRQTGFEVGYKDFQSVTCLSSGNLKNCSKTDSIVSLPFRSVLENCDDTLENCMFAEIESGCTSTNDVCSNSIYNKEPMTTNSPTSPVNINPMDETFNNYRFTEIEENYSCFNNKGLKDNDLVPSSLKSPIIEYGKSCANPENSFGRSISLLCNKNDFSNNEFVCHESEVLNKIGLAKSYHSLENKKNKVLLEEKSWEDSYMKSCSNEKDIFNSTLSTQKSVPNLETGLDKEHFLSTSKDCFDNLDAISTEEFRNNNLENHNELNESSKEDVLNQSIDNSERSMLYKSSGNKLDITLTDIMQQLLKKRDYNEANPNMKNQSLHKHLSRGKKSSFESLSQEITSEVETKDHECIPGPYSFLDTGETVFLTQEYLEKVEPEVSIDTSVVYYQQSFDDMISAEIKSRLQNSNCAVPPVEQDPLLLDQTLSSVVGHMVDKSPDDSFINTNYSHNENDASNLNKSVHVTEKTINSLTDTDYFNNDIEIKVSQYEHISLNPAVTCSPKVFMGVKDLKECNNIEFHSKKVHSNISKFPNQTSCNTGISVVNGDFISQRCLQQFNNSFHLGLDNSVSQKKENNLDQDKIEEINVNVLNSPHNISLILGCKNIDISEECLSKVKSETRNILDKTVLSTKNGNVVNDEEENVLENKNTLNSANIKNILSEDEFTNIQKMNKYNEPITNCSSVIDNLNVKLKSHHLAIKNFALGAVNNDKLETVQTHQPVLFKKPFNSVTSQKSDNFSLTTALGKSINISEESLSKIKSIFKDDLIVTNQDHFWKCLTKSSISSSKEDESAKNKDIEYEPSINQANKAPLLMPSKACNFMFSSASGKNINVSEDALVKVESKFSEILENNLFEVESTEAEIVDEAPKTFLSDSSKKDNLLFSNTSDKNIYLPSSSKNDNFMFSTAGGKNIKVSDVALAKIKSKYSSILESHEIEGMKDEAESDTNQAQKTCLSSSCKANNFMFSSSNSKTVKPLFKIESKSNHILKTNPTIDENTTDKTNKNPNPKIFLPETNQTANFMISSVNRTNNVSEDALVQVKNSLNDIFECSTEIETNINQAYKSPVSSKSESFMFSTAGGKHIKVSNVALAEVQSKFHGIMKRHETEVINDKAGTDVEQAPKSSLPSSIKNDNFMFTSASGKNIKVSKDALDEVKSKFSEIFDNSYTEVTNAETEKRINQTPKISVSDSSKNDSLLFSNTGHKNIISLPSSSKNDNYIFSRASGKNIKISKDALSKVKLKFSDIFDNSLKEVNNSGAETHINPTHITSVPSSGKNDNYIFLSDISKNINVSDFALAKVKPNFNEIEIMECHEMETLMDKSSTNIDKTLLPSCSNGGNFVFSGAGGKNGKISENVLAKTKSKFYEVLASNITEDKTEYPKDPTDENQEPKTFLPGVSGSKLFMFSSASGKNINVSEDALARVKSKFSDIFDNSLNEVKTSETEKNIDQESKSLLTSSNKADNFTFSTSSEHLSEIKGCLAPMPMLKSQSSTNDKKSKSSHAENSVLEQPSAKKVCFIPGIVNLTQKLSNDVKENIISKVPKMSHLAFTQSLSQSILDKEVDIIEKKKCTRKIFKINDNKLNTNIEECFETKELESNKGDSQFSTEDSNLTMIYEVSDSAAAFMADCTPDRSVLSSPSSFFNRKSMKPIKLLDMEFDDVDDEIMVAAELEITPEPNVENFENNHLPNDPQYSKKFKTSSVEVILVRGDQRKRADEIINQKLKNRPLASPGFYLTLRKEGNLKRFCDILQPFLDKEQLFHLGLKKEILFINSTNAEMYEFSAESFLSYKQCFSTEGIIDLGYGFSLILSDDNKIGLSDISRCFLSNPNVDPCLVSSGWLKNHYKWIVWKLACYERAFPNYFSNRSLTPENVLHQLKYRYDREIDLAQRPALRKILECDEPSSRRLIACVANIQNVVLSDDESSYEIELTDGWYSIWACIDPAMKKLIDRQKVKIGTKLIIHAAELLNCPEGCNPLEIAISVRLKLHTNCIRRVKWHTKMGFTKHLGPIRIPLSSIFHNGGLVGLTSAVIARVYPLLYMSKDAGGKTVLRNAYAEHHVSCLKENDLSLKSEELFEKLFPEVESKYKRGVVKYDKNNIKKIKDPELLWKIVLNESDPFEIQSLMTPDQLLDVRNYHEVISSKIREEVQSLVKKKLEELIPSQKAKCLLKLRLVDPVGDCNALLTVWNPSEDLLKILVEKKSFDLYSLNASGIRDKVLLLSSTSRTIYKESNVLKSKAEFERKVTAIYDIVINSVSAQFGEIDVVGTVIFVKEPEKPWGVTNVYLSDSQENFLLITFWTSLKTLGCDDTLKPGSTVACINLQWRQGSGSYVIPSTYANEMTYFSTNPNQEYLINSFQENKSSISIKGLENFIIEGRRRLFTILKEREYSSKAPVSRVETPKVLKRLENLKRYGEASPLPKLSLLSSPDIHRNFRSPKFGSS